LEPLSGYLKLAQALFEKPANFAEGWNFGPNENDAKPVNWILDEMINSWQGASWVLDQSEANPHEASYLRLDISKAKSKLFWKPVWSLSETLLHIVSWHRAWLSGADMQKISINEISKYTNSMDDIKDG
jgi:CDP-glucose 4,6-dehydratase